MLEWYKYPTLKFLKQILLVIVKCLNIEINLIQATDAYLYKINYKSCVNYKIVSNHLCKKFHVYQFYLIVHLNRLSKLLLFLL